MRRILRVGGLSCVLLGLTACGDDSDASVNDDVTDDDTAADDDADDSTDDDTADDTADDTDDDSVDDSADVDDVPDDTLDDDAADDSADDAAVDDTTDPVPTGDCGNAAGQIFPPDAPWNQNIADAPLDAESEAIISYLDQNHDTGTRFQIDFSFRLLQRGPNDERREFEPSGDFYSGECDPAPIPVPEGGALEGEQGYACESDGDCHLLVLDQAQCRLYEMWRADIQGDSFAGGCQAIWETDRVYPDTLRGDGCTSADASGLPISPLLFTADEVAAGEIKHAIRFILPNSHIRDSIYVRPGTHSTGATSGPDDAPPYAARLRMRADVDISGLSAGAQVVAEALKNYGMILVDAGNLTFTGMSDADTEASWDDAQLTAQDLKGLEWTDFEVVELGERIDYDQVECSHEPVTD